MPSITLALFFSWSPQRPEVAAPEPSQVFMNQFAVFVYYWQYIGTAVSSAAFPENFSHLALFLQERHHSQNGIDQEM